MPTMIISGGGMSSLTPASYFRHDSFTLQVTIVQVRQRQASSVILPLSNEKQQDHTAKCARDIKVGPKSEVTGHARWFKRYHWISGV